MITKGPIPDAGVIRRRVAPSRHRPEVGILGASGSWVVSPDDHQPATVGRPGGVREGKCSLSQAAKIPALHWHDVNGRDAVGLTIRGAIGDEGDARTVRGPDGLRVVAVPSRQLAGLAATTWDRPDVVMPLNESTAIEAVADLGDQSLVGDRCRAVPTRCAAWLLVRCGGQKGNRLAIRRPGWRRGAEGLPGELTGFAATDRDHPDLRLRPVLLWVGFGTRLALSLPFTRLLLSSGTAALGLLRWPVGNEGDLVAIWRPAGRAIPRRAGG